MPTFQSVKLYFDGYMKQEVISRKYPRLFYSPYRRAVRAGDLMLSRGNGDFATGKLDPTGRSRPLRSLN